MAILKRIPLAVILFVTLSTAAIGWQTKTTYAQQATPAGSCGDTVSDDAQLFGSRIADIVNQARTINGSLQTDTRVVTVSQNKLAGRTLQAYSTYIQSQCPQWAGADFIILILVKGNEPFLHLGSTFNGKMTAADFQQITLSIRSEFDSGNYAQGSIDLLKQVQKKLSPDYTWIWVTLGILIVLGAGAVLAVMVVRRRQAATIATNARENATQAKQTTVNASSQLGEKIEELSPRIEVLTALIPEVTATQLHDTFESAKERTSSVQERLGNLLSDSATNPGSETLQPMQYAQMQRAYQEVYHEAQQPQYLLHAVEAAVQRLERNPQEVINFQQLLSQGSSQRNISQQQLKY